MLHPLFVRFAQGMLWVCKVYDQIVSDNVAVSRENTLQIAADIDGQLFLQIDQPLGDILGDLVGGLVLVQVAV